jgi:hypothetical protein
VNPFFTWVPIFFGMLMGFAGLILTAWVIYIIVDGIRRRQQLRASAEFQARLIDRIGSAREFGEFLASEPGAQFLAALRSNEITPATRILNSVRAGVVALVIGVAVFIFVIAQRLDPNIEPLVSFAATIALSIGLGLLISAWLSLRLADRLGITAHDPRPRAQDPTRVV